MEADRAVAAGRSRVAGIIVAPVAQPPYEGTRFYLCVHCMCSVTKKDDFDLFE